MRNQSAFKSSFAAVAFNSESRKCIKKTKADRKIIFTCLKHASFSPFFTAVVASILKRCNFLVKEFCRKHKQRTHIQREHAPPADNRTENRTMDRKRNVFSENCVILLRTFLYIDQFQEHPTAQVAYGVWTKVFRLKEYDPMETAALEQILRLLTPNLYSFGPGFVSRAVQSPFSGQSSRGSRGDPRGLFMGEKELDRACMSACEWLSSFIVSDRIKGGIRSPRVVRFYHGTLKTTKILILTQFSR